METQVGQIGVEKQKKKREKKRREKEARRRWIEKRRKEKKKPKKRDNDRNKAINRRMEDLGEERRSKVRGGSKKAGTRMFS